MVSVLRQRNVWKKVVVAICTGKQSFLSPGGLDVQEHINTVKATAPVMLVIKVT